MDVSTRKLRYFVAVAEELHFSRAAARLFVAQQSLSKQVRELEDDIGTQLLRRSTRSVELTPAGKVLLVSAREALAAIDADIEITRRTGRGEVGTLKLGFVSGSALELTPRIRAEFNERQPGVHIDLHEFAASEAAASLADGECDLAFLRTPITATGLEFEPLLVEPLVAAISSSHNLAKRRSVQVAELLDEPMVVSRTDDDLWRRYWTLDAYRDGRPARVVARTGSHTEQMELVAAGVGWALTPAAAARFTPRPDIRYLPHRRRRRIDARHRVASQAIPPCSSRPRSPRLPRC